ncbi:NACHT domain-containing protein [Candidatus Parabeggiatoa sp. HSG14]|uniref:NACHT domain-containing protein n=1 Tax=Candidatus Parabeggiatoa sp. HSG14 TaxID=3055593 RepID=UPI0025A7FA43|nr:NACHT domain-containing protein [Thiotrichales bacterium HSG14]
MIKKHFLFILTAILLSFLSLTLSTKAENNNPSPRDVLMAEIQKRAQRDIEHNKPQKTLQELHLLFGENAKAQGLSISQVEEWYEEAYQTVNIPKSGFEKFMENQLAVMGWSLAIVFFIFHFLREAINKFIIHVFTSTKNWLYRRLAGYRPFRKIALRKYRQALIKNFREFKVPFRPDNRPLKMHEVYIPLKVKGTKEYERIDAYQAITEHQRLMVVGEPGAGKSTLLKHIALSYAEGNLTRLPKQPVVILLEIGHLREDDLLDDLVKELDKKDFPNARNFVEIGIENGTLMLLFDGLDEVSSEGRQIVVDKISELLDKYSQCRAVITCRKAVYHNEFATKTDQTLEIDSFRDNEIQQFLQPWQKDMSPGKSVKQLIHTLHERPRIMQLAGNPLLLTIIAYLYTDTAFVLPHSRAKFYSEATQVLLEQWHREHNHYEAAKKQAVLRHLAFFNQGGGVENKPDWRTMKMETVLAEIKKVLPTLNLTDKDADLLLEEIVNRSGLLQKIDGGERYQFAHLTLQEFFAAVALRYDITEILTRFKKNPDTWREVVKIWCGLDHDSTDLIQAIYAENRIMAFECIADAQQVSAELADEIIGDFKSQLGSEGEQGEAINRAFAAVASNTTDRGKTIFKYLADILADTEDGKQQRVAAANVLSMTHLDDAAKVLDNYYHDKNISNEIRSALRSMGDIAAPLLGNLLIARKYDRLDDLREIGTPKAALMLIPFLWHKDKYLASRAALNLATLLPKPEVENALRGYSLTKEQRKAKWFVWFWNPFVKYEPNSSLLFVIAGRIGYLIDQLPEIYVVNFDKVLDIDPRIVIPLVVQDQPKWKGILGTVIKEYPKEEFVKIERILKDETIPTPILDDWEKIFLPSEYKFEKSWHLKLIFFLLIIFFMIHFLFFPVRAQKAISVVLIILLGLKTFFGRANWELAWINILLIVGVISLATIFPLEYDKILLEYFSLLGSWKSISVIWLTFAFFIVSIYIRGRRKEREAQNPLHGLLEPPKTNTPPITKRQWLDWFRWFRKD